MFKNIFSFFASLFDKKKPKPELKAKIPDKIEPKYNPVNTQVDKKVWEPLKFADASDEDDLIEATYENELGFKTATYCMAVFESNKEYKLVAPWLDIGVILQKANTHSFSTKNVKKSLCKDYDK